MFLQHFRQILNDNIEGDGWTIVDAFGGSGLLSHTAKQLKPQARVIYNDFDNYAKKRWRFWYAVVNGLFFVGVFVGVLNICF